ncbi:BQ5605_C078g12956 [Microbotryum silenes-dioicae]|uniref:BQ5605_C078g12956 protein n=1 Tax=Microbotryum silenes-dioicae TaxID=796604 RepID=A0A2X0LNC8_9BASI|nr:BQ5605_C090g13046 [Microbotryum silenes-dioicae]SGZ34171.1 BQ5605_C078g12956 [Microbotryum silenes-dioicae]
MMKSTITTHFLSYFFVLPGLINCNPSGWLGFFFFLTGAHKLQSFGLAGTATKRAKGGYKATTASSWVKVKPLRAKSAAQIKTRRAPNADSNGR